MKTKTKDIRISFIFHVFTSRMENQRIYVEKTKKKKKKN